MLPKEAGCNGTELDYTEQTSWLHFLKYLDGLEQDRATEMELEGKTYSYILAEEYRWESWAAPNDALVIVPMCPRSQVRKRPGDQMASGTWATIPIDSELAEGGLTI